MTLPRTQPSSLAPMLGAALAQSVTLFTRPGQGQTGFGNREQLHLLGAKRPLSDPLMYSHAPFMAASFNAARHGIFELAVLTTVTTLLSILYHRTYERPGKLCTAESIVAKLLFAYGAAQLPRAPTPSLLRLECVFLSLTIACFFVTNIFKHLYDKLHIGMHIVPAIWCFFVGTYHSPLFSLF